MEDYGTRIALVERDLEGFKKFLDKLDLTLTSVTGAASDVSRLLAVHDNQIANQTEWNIQHQKLDDMNFQQIRESFEKLTASITNQFDNLSIKIDNTTTENKTNIISLESRIIELEKFHSAGK